MKDYDAFLRTKQIVHESSGTEVSNEDIHESLFDFQRDLVRWSLRKGRASIFADTGLGKTRMQLEWARLTDEPFLILAPLAVAQQTVDEAAVLGIKLTYAKNQDEATKATITNYERLDRFDPSKFGAVVLDESSILKSFDSKTRGLLIKRFLATPWRLCCTATPAPNDTAELGNHAEFLGLMTRAEMLATFFVHDNRFWILKGHAKQPFYRWLASWGMTIRKPSDLGYVDDGFALPKLSIMPKIVEADYVPDGQLFATGLSGIQERSSVRKQTAGARVEAAAAMVAAEPEEPWLVWCGLNAESDALAKAIPGAVEVKGSDSSEWKMRVGRWFTGQYEEECECPRPLSNDVNTCGSGTGKMPTTSESTVENEPIIATPECESVTSQSRTLEKRQEHKSSSGKKRIPGNGQTKSSRSSASPPTTTTESSPNREAGALSAGETEVSINPPALSRVPDGSMSIIVTSPAKSEGSSVQAATSDSGSLGMTPTSLNEPPCTCGKLTSRRPKVLITKISIFGFGMNFQRCARMAFVGLGDSYEQYYQAIRRCWRFGQTREVHAHIVLSDIEQVIYRNVLRKEQEATAVAKELVANVAEYERSEIADVRGRDEYAARQKMEVPKWL